MAERAKTHAEKSMQVQLVNGDKKIGSHLLTSTGQYKVAINVECPFCGATVGNRCAGVVFPQYPHTARIESALGMDCGTWEFLTIDAFEQMPL